MPKLKSKRGAAKRFRVTVGGIKYRRSNRGHGFTNKSAKRKLHLRKAGYVKDCSFEAVSRMLHGS